MNKHLPHRFLLFITFVFLMTYGSPTFIWAQSDKDHAILAGQVENLSVEKSDASTYKLIARIKFKLTNNGNQSLMFLKHLRDIKVPAFVGATLYSASTNEVFIKDWFGESYEKNSPFWQQYRKTLDTATPSTENLLFLKPGEVMEFEDTVWVYIPDDKTKSGYSPKRASFEDLRAISRVNLQLSYRNWSGSLDAAKENGEYLSFAKQLRKRWERYGFLWTDTITSQPISLELGSILSAIDKE